MDGWTEYSECEMGGNTVGRLDYCTIGWVEYSEMNRMMDGTQGDQ